MATNNDIITKLESELQELKEARVSEDGGWFPKYGDIFIYVRSFLISYHSFKGNWRKGIIVSYLHRRSIYGEGYVQRDQIKTGAVILICISLDLSN
jgi:hypothetical protein